MFRSLLFPYPLNGPNQKSVSDVKVYPKSLSDKMLTQMLLKKKNDERKMGKKKSLSNRFPVTVIVPGSAGPIRLMASEGDTVSEMIDVALMLYGREERLPQLGSEPANSGLDGKVIDCTNMDVKLLMKSISDKTMADREGKKIAKNGSRRFLVTVNFPASFGPIWFVVGEGDAVSEVIDAARKFYGREERLPQSANAGFDGSQICKERHAMTTEKRSKSWKAWFNKSLTFKISSH